MSAQAASDVLAPRTRRRAAAAAGAVLAPLLVLALVLALPHLDGRWENHAAHFWLVLAAGASSTGLGYAVSVAARRRRDARLFLISLAFVASAGFLALHALATPDVLLGPNAGFELATPVGLLVAGVLAALSGLEVGARDADRLMRRAPAALLALLVVMALWAVLSLTQTWPLSGPLGAEELNGWQVALAAAGIALYAAAALAYARLYRRRRQAFLLVVACSFGLLAEAMIVIAWARNWQVSWWEWHLLMLCAFAAIATSARREWYEERWSALYLDETLAGAREVSILFADLEGFTSFSERTPPAAVVEMLNAYFAPIVPMMEAAGGEVYQIIGDELMVIFNKRGDTPDHALRAARAALDLQRAACRMAREHPAWPRFRVGVNSGEVLAGVLGAGRGHRTHAVVGDTVNLAARLEGGARAGQVVLGAETVRRLPVPASLERLPALRLKGKRKGVEAYLLHGLDEH